MFGSDLGFGGGDGGDATAGEDFEAEVAAAFGPFIGLFGEDSPDEADDGGPGGEDADGVGAAANLAVEAFECYLEPASSLWR